MDLDPAVLLGPATAELREQAAEIVRTSAHPDVDQLLRLTHGTDRELAREILVQETLRRRAEPRFGALAGRMLFTREGLEQASRPVVAGRRAARLAERGIETFADLGCGIGADSMAARRAGLAVVAFERDERTAAVARHNISSIGWAPYRVAVADVTGEAADPDGRCAWFVDPARRSGHRADGTPVRSLKPEAWQPPWSWVLDLAQRKSTVVAKAAPGIPHGEIPDRAAVEWVSVGGSLVEATVWFGELAEPLPARAAVILQPSDDPWTAASEQSLSAGPQARQAATGPLADWLLEPDPAVIRSHLLAELCDKVQGHLVSPGIAYIAALNRPDATFGRVDRVVAVLPGQPRKLRQELRRLGIGSVEIRTRGLALRPEALRRELRLAPGGGQAGLVLTRVAGRPTALMVEHAARTT